MVRNKPIQLINYRSIRRKTKGLPNIRQVSLARRIRFKHQLIRLKLKDPIYRVALHEAGHYAVLNKLQPQVPHVIILERTVEGEWVGHTKRLTPASGPEDLDQVGQVSIAGAVAETTSIFKAYELLTTHPGLSEGKNGDYHKFGFTWAKLKRELESNNIWGQREYFQMRYREVIWIRKGKNFLWLDRLACRALVAHSLQAPNLKRTNA